MLGRELVFTISKSGFGGAGNEVHLLQSRSIEEGQVEVLGRSAGNQVQPAAVLRLMEEGQAGRRGAWWEMQGTRFNLLAA